MDLLCLVRVWLPLLEVLLLAFSLPLMHRAAGLCLCLCLVCLRDGLCMIVRCFWLELRLPRADELVVKLPYMLMA